jgi:2-haloacid dehalogenase
MSSTPMLAGIKACVFDAYGTLFDVHSAVRVYQARLGPVAETLSGRWRSKQLEYTWLRSLMQRHADFWQVTREALEYACQEAGVRDESLKADLMNAYLRLECYPDVLDCLTQLRNAGLRLAILSNGSPAMLDSAVRVNHLEGLFEAVASVEEVGIYKPSPRVYQLAVDRLRLDADAISFQSANAWDAVAAASSGMRVAWINRFRQPREQLPFQADVEISSLAELPGALGYGRPGRSD